MLDTIGLPLLRWLDETALPETYAVIRDARHALTEFHEYVVRWRELLEDGQ